MADTTWIIGTIIGITIISISVFSFMVHILDWVRPLVIE